MVKVNFDWVHAKPKTDTILDQLRKWRDEGIIEVWGVVRKAPATMINDGGGYDDPHIPDKPLDWREKDWEGWDYSNRLELK